MEIDEVFAHISLFVDQRRTLGFGIDLVHLEGRLLLGFGKETQTDFVGLQGFVQFLDLALVAVQKIDESTEALVALGGALQDIDDGFDIVIGCVLDEHLTRRCEGVFSNGANGGARIWAGDVDGVVGGCVFALL